MSYQPITHTTPISVDDQDLLECLQKQPSEICKRCSIYDVLSVFSNAKPKDRFADASLFDAPSLPEQKDNTEEHDKSAEYIMFFNSPADVLLISSCQLCRLLYRILPRGISNTETRSLRITPFRSYRRVPGWNVIPQEERDRFAIFLGLELLDDYFEFDFGRSAKIEMGGEVIALSTHDWTPRSPLCNARFIPPQFNFTDGQNALEFCERNHGDTCRPLISQDLHEINVLDVDYRSVVPYEPNCEYFALSYVWGGVIPPPDALQSKTLPQTIEDAIEVTKKLGKRYLWVDQLCLNQKPNPTPQEAAAFQKQLKMMDQIYAGASLTLVAAGGSDSNSGIAGVSSKFPRRKQLKETINGHSLFTVPISPSVELESSIWSTRAWTLQEGTVSRRYLYFTESQVTFICPGSGLLEQVDWKTDDTTYDPVEFPALQASNAFRGISSDEYKRNENSTDDEMWKRRVYANYVQDYTSRRMTNPDDSLNAFLGLISNLERHLFREGLVLGIPLYSSPQLLGWFHDKRAEVARRPKFPSWCWAGWGGEVLFPNEILDVRTGFELLSLKNDMTPKVIDVIDGKLKLEGWIATVDIVTDPFSEARHPDKQEPIGIISERNFPHNNTVRTGKYSCLIVLRNTSLRQKDGPEFQTAIMLILDWHQDEAERRTLIKLTTFTGGDIMDLCPVWKAITLV